MRDIITKIEEAWTGDFGDSGFFIADLGLSDALDPRKFELQRPWDWLRDLDIDPDPADPMPAIRSLDELDKAVQAVTDRKHWITWNKFKPWNAKDLAYETYACRIEGNGKDRRRNFGAHFYAIDANAPVLAFGEVNDSFLFAGQSAAAALDHALSSAVHKFSGPPLSGDVDADMDAIVEFANSGKMNMKSLVWTGKRIRHRFDGAYLRTTESQYLWLALVNMESMR